MSNIHSFGDYSASKQVLKDFPVLIKNLDLELQLLYRYKMYVTVSELISQMEYTRETLLLTLQHYAEINDKKGQL